MLCARVNDLLDNLQVSTVVEINSVISDWSMFGAVQFSWFYLKVCEVQASTAFISSVVQDRDGWTLSWNKRLSNSCASFSGDSV